MSEFVLKFGMVRAVIVDTDNIFRSTFEVICKILKLVFWPLSHGNHQCNGVEQYPYFLNKTQTISGQDRGTYDIVHHNMKTSQYAWNSVPIDNTDIPRCVAVIGREFKLPLDVKILEQPTLNDNTNSTLFHYLCNVSCNSRFAASVVHISLEECRKSNREIWSKNKTM